MNDTPAFDGGATPRAAGYWGLLPELQRHGQAAEAVATRRVCVVLHDVAPATWPACEALLTALGEVGRYPVTLLAVPRYHGQSRSRAFERWLQGRAEAGDEVALHGFEHLDRGTPANLADWLRRRVYTRGEGEFWGLGFDQATARLQAGRRWLRSLGLVPTGFVAPAWLMGPDAWRALRAQPFEYTCTLRHLYRLRGATEAPAALRCQAQVYSRSTLWRQVSSLAWNAALAAWQHDQPLVRLELHPGDELPPLRDAWLRLLAGRWRGRQAVTLHDAAAAIEDHDDPAEQEPETTLPLVTPLPWLPGSDVTSDIRTAPAPRSP